MEVFSIPDVAKLLGIPYITVYKAVQRLGAGRKIGDVWILDDHDLESIREECSRSIANNA